MRETVGVGGQIPAPARRVTFSRKREKGFHAAARASASLIS